jgi:hypothetical protein
MNNCLPRDTTAADADADDGKAAPAARPGRHLIAVMLLTAAWAGFAALLIGAAPAPRGRPRPVFTTPSPDRATAALGVPEGANDAPS